MIHNQQSSDLMPLPRGVTYLEVRQDMARGDEPIASIDRIRAADRLLQTADCVGSLLCCASCENPVAPCPVALDARLQIVKAVLNRPVTPAGLADERSVLLAAMDAW